MHPCDAEDLEFDEANEAHLAVHNITVTEVTHVWLGGPVYSAEQEGIDCGLAHAWRHSERARVDRCRVDRRGAASVCGRSPDGTAP